jgi:protein TonB
MVGDTRNMTISISAPATLDFATPFGNGVSFESNAGDGGVAMSAVAEAAPDRPSSGGPSSGSALEAVRWVTCFVIAAALHGIVAYYLLERISETEDDYGVDTPVVVLDLAEAFVSSVAPPRDLTPGPVETEEVEATPPPKEELKQQPEPEAEVTPPTPEPPKLVPEQAEVVLPKPEPPPKPEPEPPPPTPTAPQVARTPPPSVVRWQSQLRAHIERFKRYPQAARREGGIATVAFAIDHEGHLLRSNVVQSSGSAALDQETLAMLVRAQPMPRPPDQLADDDLTFTIPVRFFR